jgi:putative ATP-binding cassette transporter
LFLPQKSYLPSGSLKQALAYPSNATAFSDELCRQVLVDCELAHLADELHAEARWAHRLSPGEQQRLAFARALLAKPDILFMDESTSALDDATEAHMYALLQKELPAATWLSVAHRNSLEKFHDHQLVMSSQDPAVRVQQEPWQARTPDLISQPRAL